MAERSSGGISSGEHLIHDAIMATAEGAAWSAVDSGASGAKTKFHALVLSLTTTTETTVAGTWSGGQVLISNQTGVDVLLKLGTEATPDTVESGYGQPIVPAGTETTLSIPGLRMAVVSATAQSLPTAASPRLIINFVNAFQQGS